MITAYCVTCRKRDSELEDITLDVNTKLVPMIKAKCKTCHKNVSSFFKRKRVKALMAQPGVKTVDHLPKEKLQEWIDSADS
jgi:hypothetical protein